MQTAIAPPLDEERKLRVFHDIEDADLLPGELDAIGANAVTGSSLAAQTLLDDGNVINGDNPAHPAAALVGTLLNGATEGCLVGGGVVERRDNLDVAPTGERKNEVAGAE